MGIKHRYVSETRDLYTDFLIQKEKEAKQRKYEQDLKDGTLVLVNGAPVETKEAKKLYKISDEKN